MFTVLAVNSVVCSISSQSVVCSISSHWCCLQYWLPMVLSSVLIANGVICSIDGQWCCLQDCQSFHSFVFAVFAANGHISSTQLAASDVGLSNTAVKTIAIVLH